MAVAVKPRRHLLAELFGVSRNGKPRPLSERDVRLQIYGERSERNGKPALGAQARPRDARGRFVPRSPK